jgi:hypothetical protein
MVHTARADSQKASRTEERRPVALVSAPVEPEHDTLREWCEIHAHPRGRLADGECLCGLIRYDE